MAAVIASGIEPMAFEGEVEAGLASLGGAMTKALEAGT